MLRKRAVALVLLVCWAFALQPSPLYAQRQGEPLPVAEYLAELERAAEELAATPNPATVRKLQQRLQRERRILLPNETVIDVVPLLGDEEDDLPTVEIAQQRLTLMITQLQAAPTDQFADRLALLESILQRTEFVGQDSLWDRFWRWVRSLVPDPPSTTNAAEDGLVANGITLLGWLVIGVGALLLVYLLSFWLQNLLGSFAFGVEQARSGSAADEPQSAVEARQQAHRLAADGSFREAVRRMYLSALLALDEQALLHYDRSSTNREVLATVRGNQPLYEKLQPVVEMFDEVWYGIHEPDRATFEHYVQAVEQLPMQTEGGRAHPTHTGGAKRT